MIERSPRTVVFLHLFKCGGTTVIERLRRAVPAGKFEHVRDPKAFRAALAADPARAGAYDIVAGHIDIRLMERHFPMARWITVLRDPVDRMLSQYEHFRRAAARPDETGTEAHHFRAAFCAANDLAAFVTSDDPRLTVYTRNFMARKLAGGDGVCAAGAGAVEEGSMDAVVVERRGRVALVRLARPERMNCLDPEIRAGLAAAVPALVGDAGVGAVVITGSAEAFCAGGDLSSMDDRRTPSVRARLRSAHAWVRLLVESDTPVITAVNGAAVGAGFALALLGDFAILSEKAYFRAGFPAVGAAPDLGLGWTLPRAVGAPRAREILLTNRRVDAAEAVAIGLAVRAVPHAALEEEATAVAAALAAGPATAHALAKGLVRQAGEGSFAAFLDAEAAAQAVAFASADFGEGVAAFHDKRKPVFGG